MANVKSKQGTKTNTFKNTKKKKQEEDRFGKKGKQLAKKANAEKTGESKLKKTGNSRADERREGAVRAQKNPVNVMRSGAQNYIIKDKAQGIATAPTKVVSGTLKNSQNTAGLGRGRRSGTVTNTTKRTETLTKDQLDARKKAEEDRKKKIADNKKANDKNGYSYGNGVIKTLDKYNKTVDKKFEESKKKDLNYGASVLSDKKVDIPFYTKYAQDKAEKAAKAELKKGGVTQAKGKDNVDKWIADTEKEWKSQGYDVKDDVVVTEDGKTWGQIKQEAYDQTAAQIRAERSKYIHQSADGAGKLSAQDIYKGVVPMASEFIDYGVPYMATAKGSIKVAEKLMAKAAKAGKAGKVGAKAVPKIEKEISKMVADGKLTPEAAAKFNKKIALKSGAKSFSKELVANALQDATIGTTIDLAKGIGEGLQGEELQKYMKDNAVANLALGIPMSGIAGRAGAKEAKTAMSMDYAKAINDAVNITKPEAIKLENLLKKQERGTISGSETETLKELQNKALGEGGAVVNSKGKLEINKTDFAVDDLTKPEATEYFKLKAQSERGSIDSRDIPRFNELRGKVESAYRQAEVNAQKTINVSGRKITSNMQENAEAAVRFYERTGDKAKLKQAQDVLEKAQKATVAKNEALATNLDKMNDITKGNYRWVDSAEMEKLAGDGKVGGYYDETTGEIIVNRDSPQAYQTVVGHETMHMLKAANREGYDKLANMLRDYVKELGDGQYDSLVAEVKRAYPELVAKGDTEGLDEELVSEMLGRYVFGEDDTFIKKLAGEDPTVLQKIIAYIKQFIANSNNKELADQFAKMEKTALDEIQKVKELDWKERGLKEVTGKEKQELIKKSQFTDAPISSKDGMYSYAYEAAGKLGKSVKSDADSLLKYFKKKGVTAEEMKWTGLETFIRENEPVSRQQMLDFIESNNYELYTIARGGNPRTLGDVNDDLYEALTKNKELYDDVFAKAVKEERESEEEFDRLFIRDDVRPQKSVEERVEEELSVDPWEVMSDFYSDEEIERLTGVSLTTRGKGSEAKWDDFALRGGSNYREYEYVDPRFLGYSNEAMRTHWDGDKDVVVHSRIQDFTEGQGKLEYLDEYDLNVETVSSVGASIAHEVSSRADSDAPFEFGLDLSQTSDRLPIQIDIYERRSVGDVYTVITSTDTGEILSDIKSTSLRSLPDDVAEDLLQLGRGTKVPTFKGGTNKVLHIEEIQSDWHNAGQKSGYGDAETDKVVSDFAKWDRRGEFEARIRDVDIDVYRNGGRIDVDFVSRHTGEVLDEGRLNGSAGVNDFERLLKSSPYVGNSIPEAPYKNNYTDYAMKRALREAVENDYDVISWTTAKQQAERWSDEYMEGYRIEYDQDIPSFMKKYVAQWGAKVEKLKLAENGEEVWGVRITDEMRDSIKTKGQKRFSKFGVKGATGEQKELGIKAEQMFKDGKKPDEIFDETGWIVGTDGKARMRFSDRDMTLNIKMKDLKPARSVVDIQKASDAWEAAEDAFDAAVARNADDEELGRLFGNIQKAEDALDVAQNGVKEIPLGDLINHDELFKRYPDLKNNVTVKFSTKRDIGGEGSTINTGGNTWTIYVKRNITKEELMDTLVHETQHVIQGLEGFARGTSPEEWQDIAKAIRSDMDKVQSSLPSGISFEKDGNNWIIKDEKTGAASSATKPENVRFSPFRVADEKALRKKFAEWVELKQDYDNMTSGFKATPQNARDSLALKGKTQYFHTKGEWEARQAEAERNASDGLLKALEREEASGAQTMTTMDRTGKFKEYDLNDKDELQIEEYLQKYKGGRKYSKMRQEKVQSARDKTRATEKEISSVDKNLNGKITDARRKELEERRKTLEEQLEQERIELNKLNRPVYQERLERWEKELKSLESQKARARGNRLDEINRKIITAKSQITRNKNLIKNEPKKFVSDNPVNKLSDEDLTDEYRKLTDHIQKEKWDEIRERDAINSRIDALRAEAESRELDLRTNLERADDLVKDKGFGWQEAKKLANEIRDINKQVADIKNSGKLTMSKANKIRELRSESDSKGVRLTQVLDNSKSVIPEGKNAIDAFDEIVGGNTLKEKGSYKKLNKMSAKRLVEENDGLWGAAKDVAQSVRRKTESSLIEYESAGKRLIKDGQKELGQALLDQTNNVIVYKNKAAAAVETHRASADGTKTGDSLNDVFKVIDKNGKEIDLLLEANTKMRQDLSNYLFAKHSFAREEQGKKVFGMIDENGKPKWTNASTQEFMDAIVDKYGKKTVDSFERGIRDYIDYLNEYRLDTGLISKELLDKLNDIYPYYIPTNRSVVNKPPKEYELPKSTAEVENGIKRAVGGDAPLEDLYTQLVKMTMATIRSGEQNKLLSMYAKAHNIEATRLPKDATADDVLESSVEAFNSDHKGNWKVRFYDDGKAVTIPVNKHAAQGLREFNGQDYATLIEVSAKAGKLLHMREYKGLITDWNLVFGVRNGMRDAQQALVNSKDSRWFTRSVPRARAAVMNENNAFRILYDANGGRYSTLQQVNRLDEIGALNKNKSTVAKGLEKIEDFNGAIEMMPRMCEFIGTIQKEAQNVLGKDGVDKLMREIEAQAKLKPEAERTMWIENEYAQRIVDIIKKKKPDIIATAIRNSSDITVNFSRHGVVTRAFNAGFVPYLNPSVQGLSKMARMFTESKAQGFGALAAFGAKLGVLTIAPAIANEILCKGNEAYQSLNSRDKDNNFFIPMSLFGGEKDKFIKIPKPRENAVLAEPFEYGYRYGYRYFMDKAQYGTKDEWVQMWKSAESNVGVVSVWEDNIVSPIINTALNKTWYGGDILSKQELKNVENEEAWKNFDETTSLFAKKMGKLTNKSPKKIDAIMDSYMGLIYDFGISQTSQKNINDVYSSPKNFLKNNAIVQQFTKDAVFSNKYATKFWDRVDELNKGHKGDKDTIEKREYMAKYGYDTFTYDTAISNIDNDKSIPKEEKVEMKRELRTYKNQLLKRALDGEDVKYDPMQRIINLYKRHGIKNATDVCLSQYAEGDHADAYKTLKRSKEYRDATPAEKRELQQKFLKTYKGIKRIARFTGDSDNFINYTTAEYVCVKNGYTGGLIANAYAGKSKKYAVEKGMENMKAYIDAGYTEKNFKITMRALNRGANDLNDDEKQYASQLDDYDKAMICAKNGYRDGAYLVAGAFIGKERMNAARCLTEGHSGEDFEWTDKRVNKFCKKYELYQDKKEYTWDLEQVADAVRKEYGDKTPEEQAAVYTVITGDTENNPFGEIGDYSHKNDSGLLEDKKKGGKGGRGRGGRGRRGGRGGGGSSKGTMPKTESGAIKAKVTDPFGGSNGTKSSNLNDAYRKRVRKLRETKKK